MDDTNDVVPAKPFITVTQDGKFSLTMDLAAIGPAMAHGALHLCHGQIDAWYIQKAQEKKAKEIVKASGIIGSVRSAIWRK